MIDDDLRAALESLVERAPDPPPLEMVERRTRVRRQRRAIRTLSVVVFVIAGSIAGAVAVAGRNNGETVQTSSQPSAPPISVVHIDDAKPAIHDAKLTRALVFDGGALTLAPESGTPAYSEAQAIARYRAGSEPTNIVADVLVVSARATLRLPVLHPGVSPARVPEFRSRPAWIVISNPSAFGGCPEMPASGPTAPRGARNVTAFSVLLLSADGREGVDYATRGFDRCGLHEAGPSATVASYTVALPWTLSTGAGGLRAHWRVPECAIGKPNAGSMGNPAGTTLLLYASIAIVRGPCRPTGPAVGEAPLPATGARTRHDPPGPDVGRVTRFGRSSVFAYFDGTSHVVR